MKSIYDVCIGSKAFILVYCMFIAITKGLTNVKIIVFLLLYLILNFAIGIEETNKKNGKVFLEILSCVLILVFVREMKEIIFLLPNNLFDLGIILDLNLVIPLIVSSIIGINIIGIDVSVYMLILSLIYLIYKYNYLGVWKNSKLFKENINKNSEINALKSKLSKTMRYREQEIYTVKLKERNDIAQEMHDKIGHTLAGSIMQLEAVKFLIDKDSKKSSEMLKNTIEVLRAGMDDIRFTLRRIKPSKEELGINRIRFILEEGTKNTKFNYYILEEGNLNKITYEYWGIISEMVKECLTNTLKYSDGDKVNLSIKIFNKVVKVEFKDNGSKIYERVKFGLGLIGIEQRCIDKNGKLIVSCEKGFSVIMLLNVGDEVENIDKTGNL